ncbi:MAG: NUDIX hydrolase [Candidatus Coatesbacteria bacterium]|nr:NUDIX hydrolase [Candidatus Coatesbacteria bacterium]
MVVRDNRILMVRHRYKGEEWWCLPGGALEPGETLEEGALRELKEECCVTGTIVRKTAHIIYAPNDEAHTFLAEVGEQEPSLGHDPELQGDDAILVGVKWLTLSEISERDRAFIWASGLLGVANFFSEAASWGDEISYPGKE